MEEKKTQCEEIMEWLEEYGHISPIEALREMGCMRLSARIYDLRKKGHNEIETMMVSRKNWKGRNIKYAVYYIRWYCDGTMV